MALNFKRRGQRGPALGRRAPAVTSARPGQGIPFGRATAWVGYGALNQSAQQYALQYGKWGANKG